MLINSIPRSPLTAPTQQEVAKSGHRPLSHKIVEWTLTVGNCNREELNWTPCWICFFDFNFAFCCFCYYNHTLPQGSLPLCQNVKLKCLCSAHGETIWPCPPVNGCKKEEMNTFPHWGWSSQEMFCKTDGPFYFTSPLPLPLWFYKRNWHPDPDRMVLGDPSPPSFWSASFPNKVVFLASTASSSPTCWPAVWCAEWAWTQ